MLQPEQVSALQDVLAGGAAQVAHLLGEPLAGIETFLNGAHTLIGDNLDRLNDAVLVVALSRGETGTTKLSASRLLQETRSGRGYFRVDVDLRFVGATTASARMIDVFERTRQSRSVEVIYQGSYVYVIACGELVDERDLRSAAANPPVANPWKRPISEFDALLADHMRECIDNERRVRYWSDKSQRILLSGPDGTERIFHHDLFWWLDRFVIDRLSVFGEARGLGQDATDITVVTIGGSFVIEVKWLGKNDGGTVYEQERINEGLRQVKEYLERDSKLVHGFLVVYDGRTEEKHANESTFEAASLHRDCDRPHLMFLRSETPSVTAKRRAGRKERRRQ